MIERVSRIQKVFKIFGVGVGLYKIPQLLLADENKVFFVKAGNCNYRSRHENTNTILLMHRLFYINLLTHHVTCHRHDVCNKV